MRLGAVAAAALTMAMAGCSADYVEDSQAPVILRITSINAGAVVESDIRIGANSEGVCPDSVPVGIAVRPKNPGASIVQNAGDVFVTSYEIRWVRSDGRGVEGVDVPYRTSGYLSTVVANNENAEFPIELVRRQAKLEPPLSNITGIQIVTMFAEVTVYGENVAGDKVSATGRIQVTFADLVDTQTSCPTD